jgi:outer membrane protein OmpA-like peptidoglycan-associated protein
MIKKILIPLVLISLFGRVRSQDIYFYTGKNFTSYDFKNSSGSSNSNIKSGTGLFYHIGYNKLIKAKGFSYSLGFSLNEYNNNGGNITNNYEWENQYLGIQSDFSYSYLILRKIYLRCQIGLNGSSIINGLQQINGIYYDLTKVDEFKGLVITPSIGIQVKYNINNLNFISLGYNYCKGYNLSNSTNQNVVFNTNQIQFGIHFAIDSKNKKRQLVNLSVLEDELNEPKRTDTFQRKPIKNNALNIDSNSFYDSINQVHSKLAENINTEKDSIDNNVVKELAPFRNDEVIDDATFKDKVIFNFSGKGLNILLRDDELIAKTITYLINNPKKTLILSGFSSNDGLSSDNYTISLKRALIAKEYFIIKGIPANKIQVIGKSSSKPKFSNGNYEGRLMNKRVEIQIK